MAERNKSFLLSLDCFYVGVAERGHRGGEPFYYLLIASRSGTRTMRHFVKSSFYYLLIASRLPSLSEVVEAGQPFYYLLIASRVLPEPGARAFPLLSTIS